MVFEKPSLAECQRFFAEPMRSTMNWSPSRHRMFAKCWFMYEEVFADNPNRLLKKGIEMPFGENWINQNEPTEANSFIHLWHMLR